MADQSVVAVEKVPQQVTPIEKIQQSVAPVEKIQQSVTPAENIQQSVAPVEKIQQSVTPAEKIQQSVAPVEKIQQSVAPAEKIQQSVTPVEKEKDLQFEKLKEGGVVTYGDEALEKAIQVLEEVDLPGGLLPLKDVVESGYVKETGFVWIKQKKPIVHLFRKAGKQVAYGEEVKGFLEQRRLRELTGVRAKELFIWAPIGDISIDIATPGKIYFKSIGGLGKMFPVEAFAKGQ